MTGWNPAKNPRKKRTAGKRTAEQRDADKRFCTELFVKGYTYRQIAEKLNEHNREMGLEYQLTYKTIYEDINAVLIEWKKERFDNIENYIQLELKKLDKMEVELWQAWERSKAGKRKTKIVGGEVKNGSVSGGVLDNRQLEDTNGDPRYLDLLLKVQDRRAKLLGYNAPIKFSVESQLPKDESPAGTQYDLSVIPDEMIVEMAYKMQDAEFERRDTN